MSGYRHVLLAVDFSPEAIQVGKRAKEIATCYGAKISLIHVIEEVNISAGYELMPLLPEVPDETLVKEAKDSLQRVSEQLQVPDAEQLAVTAVSTKEGVLQTAQDKNVDLIVVGSHGRHGLSLLLGSTANACLHGAPCDVLAVRIQESESDT